MIRRDEGEMPERSELKTVTGETQRMRSCESGYKGWPGGCKIGGF